jgi:hypothetical protein
MAEIAPGSVPALASVQGLPAVSSVPTVAGGWVVVKGERISDSHLTTHPASEKALALCRGSRHNLTY